MFRRLITVAACLLAACNGGQDEADSDNHAAGLWQGMVTDQTNAQTRSAESLILPSGFWMLLTYPSTADPIHGVAQAAVFGVSFGKEQSLQGNASSYDPDDVRQSYSWAGELSQRSSIQASYFKFDQGGDDAPAEQGSVALDYNAAFDDGGSRQRLAGIYQNDDLSLSISETGLLSAQGSAGSQTGACSFTGALLAEDETFNGFIGVADLGDDPDCVTSPGGSDEEFQMLAWLTEDNACVIRTGSSRALVLGMHNGVIAHSFRRLCQAG